MPIPQTSVAAQLVPAFSGQKVFLPSGDITNTYATANPLKFFGQGVVFGATSGTVDNPVIGSVLANFAGFYVRDMYAQNLPGAGYGFAAGTPVPIMRLGEMWVTSFVAMAFTSPVYLIVDDTADETRVGMITNIATAGTQTTVLLSTVCRVVESQAAAGPCHISINMK